MNKDAETHVLLKSIHYYYYSRFGDVSDIGSARRKFSNLPTPTNTDIQLQLLSERVKSLFSFRNGARRGAKRVMVVFLTDEIIQSEAAKLMQMFRVLYRAQVKIVIIGLGDSVDMKQLSGLVKPFKGVAYYAGSLFDLNQLMVQIVGASTTGMILVNFIN